METLGLLAWGANGWGDEIAEGVLVTVTLALATLPFGLLLGLLVAIAKNSSSWLLRAIGDGYTTVFRGLPELLTIFIVYYGGQMLLQSAVESFNQGVGAVLQLLTDWGAGFEAETIEAWTDGGEAVQVNGFVAGMFALGVVFSAYSSEVFLGAFRGISSGQVEAARSLGLSRGLAFRLVVLPQLWRFALPGVSNLWLILLKDTSLVSVIALPDLLRMSFVAAGVTKQHFLFYLVACLIYLVLSMISSVGIGRIEAWSARGERRIG
ncbi:ABC transporter permease [Prosthecomicrobium sp. N25]|uniref:ABC transporter permease n=1 Tax=Prosthecomicrobium sp. N25 TaxID=3129254 RepID=UPI0030779907